MSEPCGASYHTSALDEWFCWPGESFKPSGTEKIKFRELELKEEHLIRPPPNLQLTRAHDEKQQTERTPQHGQHAPLFSRSTTPESRAAIRTAKQQQRQASQRYDVASARLERAHGIQVTRSVPGRPVSLDAPVPAQATRKQKRAWLASAKHEFAEARKALRGSTKKLQHTKQDNRDPLAKEQAAESSAAAPAGGLRKALARVNGSAQASGTLIKYDFLPKDGVHVYKREFDERPGPLGSQVKGSQELLSAEHGGELKLQVKNGTLDASAKYEASAVLARFTREVSWHYPHTLLGEEMSGTLFLHAEGMVGVAGHAQLDLLLGRVKPEAGKINGNALLAEAEAFGGARLQLAVGAAYEWHKKDSYFYASRLHASAQALLEVIGVLSGPLGFLLTRVIPTSSVEWVLGWLLRHGTAGTVPLLSLVALVEGSAGIGGKVRGAAKLQGTRFSAQVGANATWGLGLGGQVELTLDVVEAPLFLLLTFGQPELREMAMRYVKEKVHEAIARGISLWQSLADWLSADDRARELVANQVHVLMPPAERARLIDTLMDGVCGDDDEEAILTILRHSRQRGDLPAVLADLDRELLLYKVDGEEYDQLLEIIGDS